MWLSPAMTPSRPDCLKAQLDARLSHDNLSHTVLGLMGVQTAVYRPALDITAPCRAP